MTSLDLSQLQSQYQETRDKGLSLDLTRGKPSAQQLDLSNALLESPGDEYLSASGIDVRNYGGVDGLPEMKALFSDILEVPAENVIVGGNSSLTIMFDYLARACLFGVPGSRAPWSTDLNRKFLCPVPGYDRHFGITEHLGFELIAVDMTEDGPDMDQVERLTSSDHSIKGIWCVPKYSNPTGTIYTDATVQKLASMDAAEDFRIIWDNAYAEHHIDGNYRPLGNILEACQDAGNPDRVIILGSTSKMTFPGSGVSAIAASDRNVDDIRKHTGVQSIGPDKVNQLRHLQLLPDIAAVRSHMRAHADLVRPKFEMVDKILAAELGDFEGVSWTRPTGGYFVSLDIPPGLAARTITLAREAGVALTQAGAPFPYGKDPADRNIRIAPTFPVLDDIQAAMGVLCLCVKLAMAEHND